MDRLIEKTDAEKGKNEMKSKQKRMLYKLLN